MGWWWVVLPPIQALLCMLCCAAQVVGGTKHLIDVHVSALQRPGRPTTFFLLLSADIFAKRTRGTIYQHARCGQRE